ncbi:MAG: hypothetical protein LBP59_15355 [Planctomycetaceae bacterium]|nr:hypothetical protein [Planctomycetaceae bacterium]
MLVILAIPAEMIYRNESNYFSIIRIAKKYKHIDEFIKAKVRLNDVCTFNIELDLYICWNAGRAKYDSLASGPSVFIFDAKGNLVDYTPDLGDDVTFNKKWNLSKELKKISIDEVNEIIRDTNKK